MPVVVQVRGEAAALATDLELLAKIHEEDHVPYTSIPLALIFDTVMRIEDTKKWRVKYTFDIPSVIFERFLAPYFHGPTYDKFTEVFPQHIELKVSRKEYKHKTNDVALYHDTVDFDSEKYSVFIFFADVADVQVNNLDKVSEDVFSAQERNIEVIRNYATPARRKITEYLYRYKREVYDQLLDEGYILELPEVEEEEDYEEGYNSCDDVSQVNAEDTSVFCSAEVFQFYIRKNGSVLHAQYNEIEKRSS
jgi:hypothetical protein